MKWLISYWLGFTLTFRFSVILNCSFVIGVVLFYETKSKRNEQNETKRNITQRNILKCETKRNETKHAKMRNETQRNEIY